ncbi:hypothetical protein B0H14DRAFT_3096977 [Mycena olivaceomarginata]|nr:hypothetical protein B0H14DRAFT_3096977 [Mycena olivaceomarginata]
MAVSTKSGKSHSSSISMDVSTARLICPECAAQCFPKHYQRFQTAVTDLVGILVQTISSGGPGRPRIYIDPDFLRWAYGQRSTAGISRFLGVGRSTVRNALIEHGIAQPQPTPFQTDTAGEFPPGIENLAPPSQPTTSLLVLCLKSRMMTLDSFFSACRTPLSACRSQHAQWNAARLGHRVPTERVRQSLLRIDPVRRIFERIRIRQVFIMVRIERLWVDVTAQVGATWAEHFTALEIRYGLDINNVAHIWLLHFLFLGTRTPTNLPFFAEAWNQHRIQIRNSTNRSPTDMFVFDMYVNGVREENLNEEELEVYGIDWQGLRDNGVLQSQAQNNSMGEGSSSWVGRTGPPPDLSQVAVQPPTGTLTEEEVTELYSSFSHLFGSAEDPDIISLWTQALAHVRVLYPDVF